MRAHRSVLRPFGSDFPADGRFLRFYQAAFGVPSFRAQVFWAYLLDAIEQETPRAVLDVGCGGGAFTAALAKRFPASNVVGIDRDPRAIVSALSFADAMHLSNVEFYPITLEDLASASFDVVVAMGVLEFALAPVQWLRTLVSHARTGGLIALTAPNDRAGSERPQPSGRFLGPQVEEWMRDAGCASVVVRKAVRGPNRAVYYGSQALQSHRGLALVHNMLTLPLVYVDARLPGSGEVLFCSGRRAH